MSEILLFWTPSLFDDTNIPNFVPVSLIPTAMAFLVRTVQSKYIDFFIRVAFALCFLCFSVPDGLAIIVCGIHFGAERTG